MTQWGGRATTAGGYCPPCTDVPFPSLGDFLDLPFEWEAGSIHLQLHSAYIHVVQGSIPLRMIASALARPAYSCTAQTWCWRLLARRPRPSLTTINRSAYVPCQHSTVSTQSTNSVRSMMARFVLLLALLPLLYANPAAANDDVSVSPKDVYCKIHENHTNCIHRGSQSAELENISI